MRVVRLTLSTAWAAALNLAIAVAFLALSLEPEKSGGQGLGFLVMTVVFVWFGRRRLREYLRRRDAALDAAPALPEGARSESPLRWLGRALFGGTLDSVLYTLARWSLFLMVGFSLGLDAAGPIVAGSFAASGIVNAVACLRFTLTERHLGRRLYEEWRPPERPVAVYVA